MANEGTKEKLDIELEAPADFTSPEVLYQDLINTIRKYHPSDDITMIEKAYRIADEAHKSRSASPGSLISSIRSVWLLYWLIWSWIRKPLRQGFFMMWWRIP